MARLFLPLIILFVLLKGCGDGKGCGGDDTVVNPDPLPTPDYITYFAETHDGGANWDPLDTMEVDMKKLYCSALPDPVNVFLAGGLDTSGNAVVWRATDFGDTWVNVLSVDAGGGAFTEMETPTSNSSTIIAILEPGKFYRSTNSGATWSQIYDASIAIKALHFFDFGLVGVAVGNFGEIHRTTDGGATWAQVTSGTTHNLRDVHCIGNGEAGDTVIAVGVNGISRSVDAGQTWVTTDTPEDYSVVAFSQNQSGRYGIIFGTTSSLRSTDGGITWSPTGSPIAINPANDLLVSDNGNCILSYSSGVEFSSDMGQSWVTKYVSQSKNLNNLVSRGPYDGIGYVFSVGQ